jgi:hypothetical protein
MTKEKETKAQHGTRSRYVLGCRCPDCKEANKLHMRDLRAKRRGLPTPPRSGEPVRAWQPPTEPGPVELAVREELATLSASETRLSAVAGALQMARILDSPDQYPTHVRAAAVMNDILRMLRKLSGQGNGRGRLASVHTIHRGSGRGRD